MDYNKLNKVIVRNLSENSDFHDCVKMLLYRKLRRANKNVPIYTEVQLKKEIPDIYIQDGDKIIIYEIQDKITKKWKENIENRYDDVVLMIVPLKDLSRNFELLSEELDNYVVKI